jgi:hypothetical protein
MFDAAGNDVLEVSHGKRALKILDCIPTLTGTGACKSCYGAKDRVVVSFRSAARENNLLRTRADQSGHLLPRGFDRRARSLPKRVNRRSVPKLPGKVRKHGFEDARFYGRSGIMVEVNAPNRHAISIASASNDSK